MLLHELTHNEFSEHDENFWGLFRELQTEASQLDWTKSRGHTLQTSPNFDEHTHNYFDETDEKGHVLGGSKFLQNKEDLAEITVQRIEKEKNLTAKYDSKKETKQVNSNSNYNQKADQLDNKAQKSENLINDRKYQNISIHESPVENINLQPQKNNSSSENHSNFNNLPPTEMEIDPIIAADESLSAIYNSTLSLQKQLEEELNILVHTNQFSSKEELFQTLNTLNKILTNIQEHPSEEKYKKVSLTSQTFSQKIGRYKGGKEFLLRAGFIENQEQSILKFNRKDFAVLWLAKALLAPKLAALQST